MCAEKVLFSLCDTPESVHSPEIKTIVSVIKTAYEKTNSSCFNPRTVQYTFSELHKQKKSKV